jgi:hypothetical protein
MLAANALPTGSNPLDFGLRLASSHKSAAELLRNQWQQGRKPALEEFLADLTSVSPEDLSAMICVDLEARWRRSDTKPLSDRWPKKLFSAIRAICKIDGD